MASQGVPRYKRITISDVRLYSPLAVTWSSVFDLKFRQDTIDTQKSLQRKGKTRSKGINISPNMAY